MADTRKDKRAPLSLKVRFKSATLDEFVEQYSYDISRGGIFIKSKKPMKVGTLLKFEFQLKDESSLIHGVGRVVWRRDPEEGGPAPGMGIKFIKMDPDSRAFVQRIVSERENAPGTFDAGEDGQPKEDDFFPAGAAKQIDPEDRTQVRHASEFLAEALSESDGAAEEAEANAAAARQRTEEIQREREAAERATRADEEAAKERESEQADARNDDADAPAEDEPDTSNEASDDEPAKISDAPPAAVAATKKPAPKPAPKKPATPKVSEPAPVDDSSGGSGMWIGLLLVAAAAVGGYFWWQGQQTETTTTENVDVEPETPETTPDGTDLDPVVDEEPAAEMAATTVTANVVAQLLIAGEVVGTTGEAPVSIEIPAGGVEVIAQARGYRSQTLSATAGAELAFELESLPWIIRVTTVPDSSRISIGGRIVRDGERSYDEAPTEPITIAATRRGFLAANRDISESDFDAGDEAMTANVTLTLQERSTTRMTTRMTTPMDEVTMDTPTMDTPTMDTPTMETEPAVMEAVMEAAPVMEAVMEAPTMEAAPPDTVPDNPF